MALVAPDYFAGAPDPERGARNLFSYAGWVRRRCNEITAEADLDPVKIYDLAGNCQNYRTEADKWRNGSELTTVLHALVNLTREAGAGNVVKTDAEINEDYKQLYAAAGVFLTWAAANLPAQGQTLPGNPVVTINRTWPNFDASIRVTKTAAVTNQIAALRNVFA
jgi:hypothetical protein